MGLSDYFSSFLQPQKCEEEAIQLENVFSLRPVLSFYGDCGSRKEGGMSFVEEEREDYKSHSAFWGPPSPIFA